MGEDDSIGFQCSDAAVSLKVNGEGVPLNVFVSNSLAGAILGYLSAMRLEQDEIKQVNIDIKL